MAAATLAKPDVYSIVTERIVDALDKGIIPWRKPWAGAEGELPFNAISGRHYNGINVWLLNLAGTAYGDPRWLTYKQATEAGGNVRKGEKSTLIVFWSSIIREDKDGNQKKVFFLRYFNVFNVEQCEELNEKKLKAKPEAKVAGGFDPIEAAESIAQGYKNGPKVSHVGGDRAFYRPATDSISLPKREQFATGAEYYSTLFHELSHSTGHESRLNRHGIAEIDHFGSDKYGKEELVAEFSAAFLCATAGIDNSIDNSAAYIASWKRTIQADTHLVVTAAAQAQKSADHILGKSEKEEVTEDA